MDRQLWKRVKNVAAEAWAQQPDQRTAYAIHACAGDEPLSREVLSLLEAMDQVGDRFDTPLLGAAPLRASASEAIASAGPPLIGQRIGAWQIVRELGHGGMGTVYFAERVDDEFQQRVAIKLVRAWAGDSVLQARFREERRILATLDHPHIARLIDGGTNEFGLPYVVMEYVEGLPIDVFCEQARLDVRQRLEVFRRVCAAVHYAHQRLVIHRDIKTANILVTLDGTPKLLDFGIAKILEAGVVAERTRTLYRMVTPESASPEQLRGEPVTTASDVYALGVLLFRLLTGRSPYRAAIDSDTDLIRAVCDETPDPPSTIVRSIDRDLDRIVLKALRKETDRRYTTVDQLSEDLHRYAEGRPVLAAPDTAGYRIRKFIRRHRVAAGAAALLVAAIGVGVAATLWQARVAQRERTRAERQFNAVRTLAGAVLGELHDAVVKLPGSLAARELLIRRATDYLDSLSVEAADNVGLRKELAFEYIRLGQLQGVGGLPNLGDRDQARRTYLKAATLFESLDTAAMDVDSTIGLVETYLRLSDFADDPAASGTKLADARRLLDRLMASAPSHPRVLMLEGGVWEKIGNLQEAAKNYQAARLSFGKATRAAETSFRLQPDNPSAGRNLSLFYKKMGTENELLDQKADAMAWYEKALTLDRSRVARTPASRAARLDLSFSLAAMGSVLANNGDFTASVASYREAVELREAVFAADRDDDFAANALLRGYERLARVQVRAGRLDEGLAWQQRRVDTSRAWLSEHAERDQRWRSHAFALSDSIESALALLESVNAGRSTRATATVRVRRMLEEWSNLRERWVREGHSGPLPPESDVMMRVTERARRQGVFATRSSVH